MGLTLLDSSVIIGAIDTGDALYAAAEPVVRAALAADDELVASVVTAAEVLTGAKLGHHDERLVLDFIDVVLTDRIEVDMAVAERAAELRAAHPALRMADALILATADRVADVVLTADARWRKVRGLRCKVRIVR